MGHQVDGTGGTIHIDTASPVVTQPGSETAAAGTSVVSAATADNAAADASVFMVTNKQLTLTGRIHDGAGTIQSGVDESSVKVTLRDHNGSIVSGPTSASVTDGQTWSVDLGFALEPYGLYTLEVQAADKAGNQTTSSSICLLYTS